MGKWRQNQAETGRAWDVVARAKYEAEFDDHLEQLGSGQHNLLDVELESLSPLLQGAHVVHLQCSEHSQLFWNQFPNWPNELKNRLPHSYSVLAEKTGD